MKSKKRVLLTGASGTVGLALLEQLMKYVDQYDITVFDVNCRRVRHKLKPFLNRIDLKYGDLSEISDVQSSCQNQDYVIHLAAIIPPLADENPRLAERVNVLGTKNLIKALEQHSPSAFFIYSSSISVYGDRTDDPSITVATPLIPSPGDEYAKTKIAAEQEVMNSKLKWSVFRLTAIMGFGNHKISKLMFHMPLRTSLEIATPKDTGRAFVNALEKSDQIVHGVYNLGGGKNCRISYEEFLSSSFEVMGLGQLDLPKSAFADSNFHCGNYMDGDELEEILSFRNDTISSYFEQLGQTIHPIKYGLTSLFKKSIKKRLLKLSEPYAMVKSKK